MMEDSLGMNSLKAGYIDLSVQTLPDFLGAGALQEKLHRFFQVYCSFLNIIPLAGYIQLRTKGNKPIPFPLSNRC